jgi:archaellum biogenesis ATPase FlaH
MKNTTVDFSKYGKDFQETLAQLIIEERPFADQMEEVLDINFFELKYLRIFVEKIYKYRKKYEVHPTKKALSSIFSTELEEENEAVQKQVRSFLTATYIKDLEDGEYVKECSLDFCKKQKLKTALLKSVKLIKDSSYDEVENLIVSALKLGTDSDFGHDFKKDFESRYELKTRNPVTTGWDVINETIKGGLGSGELGVVIAPTGAGKSHALAHLGASALLDGKNVVHYTLEMSEERTGQRYDSRISGIHLGELFTKKEEVYEACLDIPGELIIKEYPTKSASVNTLRNHLEKLKSRDKKIDMIIVDYADLLAPTEKFRERRNELESIYEHLRSLAQKYECPVWTASQTNRSGLNEEVITMESISEAFNKCFVADFIFSLSRTKDDKLANTGRIFIAKNRNGPDGIIYPIFMDPGTVTIKVKDTEGETIVSANKDIKEKEEKRLLSNAAKLYNDMKKEK